MSLATDLRMLARGLLGRTPPPLVDRSRRAPAASPTPTAAATANVPGAGAAPGVRAGQARPVVVTHVQRETADAVSIRFRDPTGAALAFAPGQFFTVEVVIDGVRLRRAYSASSDCRTTDTATITVKRVAGGQVSSYLTDHAAPGLALAVLGPSGDFGLAPDTTGLVVAIAGGSGITPIMAIARAHLAGTTTGRLALVYGSRDADAIIFRAALDQLAAAHPDRLAVRHVLGAEGLDATAITAALDAIAPHTGAPDDDDDDEALATADDADDSLATVPTTDATYLLCGPVPMMAAARTALAARSVAPDRIREERFFAPARPTTRIAAQPVTIRRGATVTRLVVAAGDTLLDAGLAAGVPMALSCAMGGCGACAVQLTDGHVVLDEPNCLTAAERARGTILACVARPTTPCTIEATP